MISSDGGSDNDGDDDDKGVTIIRSTDKKENSNINLVVEINNKIQNNKLTLPKATVLSLIDLPRDIIDKIVSFVSRYGLVVLLFISKIFFQTTFSNYKYSDIEYSKKKLIKRIAAPNGNKNLIEWSIICLKYPIFTIDDNLPSKAAKNNNFSTLKYLYDEASCKLRYKHIYYAIKNDNIEMFFWLIKKMKAIPDINTILCASSYSPRILIKLLNLIKINSSFVRRCILINVVLNDHFELIEYLIKTYKFNINSNILIYMLRNNHYNTFLYFLENYYNYDNDFCEYNSNDDVVDEEFLKHASDNDDEVLPKSSDDNGNDDDDDDYDNENNKYMKDDNDNLGENPDWARLHKAQSALPSTDNSLNQKDILRKNGNIYIYIFIGLSRNLELIKRVIKTNKVKCDPKWIISGAIATGNIDFLKNVLIIFGFARIESVVIPDGTSKVILGNVDSKFTKFEPEIIYNAILYATNCKDIYRHPIAKEEDIFTIIKWLISKNLTSYFHNYFDCEELYLQNYNHVFNILNACLQAGYNNIFKWLFYECNYFADYKQVYRTITENGYCNIIYLSSRYDNIGTIKMIYENINIQPNNNNINNFIDKSRTSENILIFKKKFNLTDDHTFGLLRTHSKATTSELRSDHEGRLRIIEKIYLYAAIHKNINLLKWSMEKEGKKDKFAIAIKYFIGSLIKDLFVRNREEEIAILDWFFKIINDNEKHDPNEAQPAPSTMSWWRSRDLFKNIVNNINNPNIPTWSTWIKLISDKNLHIIKWLESNRYEINKEVLWDVALKGGYYQLIKWINKFVCPNHSFWNKDSFEIAIKSGNLKILKLAHKSKKCPKNLLSTKPVNMAIFLAGRNIGLIEFLLQRGYKFDAISYLIAEKIEEYEPQMVQSCMIESGDRENKVIKIPIPMGILSLLMRYNCPKPTIEGNEGLHNLTSIELFIINQDVNNLITSL
jgi:hypothetical protein